MKYSEIIGLNEYFQPVYDITNEKGTYWKQFIPNEKFYNILSEVLTSLESSTVEHRKSIWLQGAYGTGKSHAVAVVKHLLWDYSEDIEDFIDGFTNTQIRERIRNFRKGYRVFPVVLKGASNITDNRTFALVVERAVKEALKQHDISISTPGDFEKIVYQVRDNPASIDWNDIIRGHQELGMYVKDSQDLLNSLERQDITILLQLEDIFSSDMRIHFALTSVSRWLSDVAKELKEKNKVDYLMLYWDEFTTVLELQKMSVLLDELQSIAELSTNNDVFLFVVSHRKPHQTSLAEKDIKRIRDRFQSLDYSMTPITTYHIIQAAIKKKNKVEWEKIKNECLEKNPAIGTLINEIIGTEGTTVKNSIKDLFPIHPYTAYLATFIARHMGSTERSIFSFLYDKEKGFLKFIEEYPTEAGEFYLTADYLWDFFVESFERDNYEKLGSILDKHKLYVPKLEDEAGNHHVSIFKGILLLNSLHHVVKISETDSGLVSPSIDNIHSMFLGTHHEEYVDGVLEFIDSKEIISKTPDDLFLVTTSALPEKEVEDEKEKQKREYADITKILSTGQRKEVEGLFASSVLRETDVKLFWAGIDKHRLPTRMSTSFREGHSLNIGVFIGRTNQEILQIKNILNSIATEDEFKNIVFIVVEDFLTKDTFDKFIEYKARAVVSERHNFKDDKNTNDTYAEKVIDEWIYKIKSRYVEWYLENRNGKELASKFGDLINAEISGGVFRFGLETLDQLRWNAPIWTFKAAKAVINTFLFADSRHDAENKTSKGQEKNLRGIINNNRGGEYTVNEHLEIKPDADENHPIVKMSAEIRNKIETNKNKGSFHLGEALKFLSKPPYGLYTNMVNMAAMGFLMRPFVGRLYEAGTGKPLEKEMMRYKIISLFNYWQKGTDSDKLEVRFGTDEEKELINILKDVFELQDVDSLNNTRWGIRKWVNDVGCPLWTFKVSCDDDKTEKAIDDIVGLIRSIDKDINQKKIKESLDLIKDARYDLGLLIKRGQAKGLFTKWLKDIEDVNISEEDVKTVVDFLSQNTQEDVASWDEEKVRALVTKWELKRRTELDKKEGNTEMEHELVDILKDVFKLQNVSGLTDTRSKVKEWVNDVKYPLWAFKVSCDDNATKKGIDRIVWLIKSTNSDIDQKELNESLNFLKDVHHNLALLIKREQAKELFIRWLKDIENVSISDEEVETVADFLNQNMQTEVASWDENKVRERVKDWRLEKAKELKKNKANADIENELVDILTDVFKLQNVSGLTDTRSKVKEWVNDVKYPLWAFKVSCDDNATKKGIDRIVWLIKSTNSDIDQKELNESLNFLKDVHHNLALLIKREQAKELFIRWLKDIENVSISDEEVETVADFLNQNMQTEVASWDENEARGVVKDWRLKKKTEPEESDEQVREMKRKIRNYPSGRIKDLLIELVDIHPELCGWLEVYLE